MLKKEYHPKPYGTCPFCNETNVFNFYEKKHKKSYCVHCINCGARGPLCNTAQKALSAWKQEGIE